jgi:hypothetical protein
MRDTTFVNIQMYTSKIDIIHTFLDYRCKK